MDTKLEKKVKKKDQNGAKKSRTDSCVAFGRAFGCALYASSEGHTRAFLQQLACEKVQSLDESHLGLAHPQRTLLLAVDELPELPVPSLRRVQSDHRAEHVSPDLVELLALLQELLAALVSRSAITHRQNRTLVASDQSYGRETA